MDNLEDVLKNCCKIFNTELVKSGEIYLINANIEETGRRQAIGIKIFYDDTIKEDVVLIYTKIGEISNSINYVDMLTKLALFPFIKIVIIDNNLVVISEIILKSCNEEDLATNIIRVAIGGDLLEKMFFCVDEF